MEIKTEMSFVKSSKCPDVYTESRADYSLPDYLGDVRKILYTEASLRPSGRFAGGDEVEFSGVVVYNVIYLDSENQLSSVEFTSDYDYSVKCSGEKYKDSISDTRVSNYSVRLMGPRKISASASLVGSVRLSETDSIIVSGNAFDGSSTPEINTKSVSQRKESLSELVEREYAEQIVSLEGAIADEVKVIHSSAEVTVDSIEADEDSVNIKGKIRMISVIKNGEEPAYSCEKTVSYEENIPFEGVENSMKLIPEISLTSLKSNVNADENGCEVVLSGIVEFCIIGETNEIIDVLTDGYLKSCPTENTYRDVSFYELVSAETVKGSHTAELDRSEIESEGINEIIFLSAIPKVERVEVEEDGVNIVGEIRYSGVASEIIDDKVSYASIKFSSPFATNININSQNGEKIQAEARVSTHGASATVDANKLYVTCTLESSVLICEEKSEKLLASSTKLDGEEKGDKRAKITVYYPTKDDTLFSVAKRFRTSGLKVARDNDISESVFAADNPDGSLKGVKKLLIY